MLKRSTILYVALACLGAWAIFLIWRVPQIYGWAALGALLSGISISRLANAGWVKWTLLGSMGAVTLFFLGSGLLFHLENTSKRQEFAKEVAVKFEKGPFAEHLEKAKREHKKVFLDIYTAWCGPCMGFNQNVLTDTRVAAVMNQAFVNVKIDAELGAGVAIGKKYTIGGYPTLLILNADGTVAEHLNPTWLPTSEAMEATAKKYLATNK